MSDKKLDKLMFDLSCDQDIATIILIEKVKSFMNAYYESGIRHHYESVLEMENALNNFRAIANKMERLKNVYETNRTERECKADASFRGAIGIGENVLFPPIGVWDNRRLE